MTLEIGRRLIGGIWRTGSSDEGGGGGSQTVKWVDLGVVTAAALAVSGARTLYTPSAGEFVSAVRYGDSFTVVDTINLEIALHIAEWTTANDKSYGFLNTSSPGDSAATGISGRSLFNNGANNPQNVSPPLLTGALVATLAIPGDVSFLGATPGWQANHTYPDTALIIAAGHVWDYAGNGAGSGGLSGGSAPDFAGNIGGSVVDNEVTWYDEGATPAAGSVHVYIEVVTPATP